MNFDHVPAIENDTLSVRSGIDASIAVGRAECLEAAVTDILQEGVAGESVQGNVAWLCCFALRAAGAYRQAAGVPA